MGKQSIKSSTRFIVSAAISLTRKSGGFCIFCFINHQFCVKIIFEERHNQSAESGRDLLSARFFCTKIDPSGATVLLLTGQLSVFLFYDLLFQNLFFCSVFCFLICCFISLLTISALDRLSLCQIIDNYLILCKELSLECECIIWTKIWQKLSYRHYYSRILKCDGALLVLRLAERHGTLGLLCTYLHQDMFLQTI